GSWEYSTDGGHSWQPLGSVSANSALLLRPEDRLRLIPDGRNGTTGSVAFRAWDQTNGLVGTKVDTRTSGGATAFSTAISISRMIVTDVNDAPTMLASMAGASVNEGQTAANIELRSFNDVDFSDNVSFSSSVGIVTKSGTNQGFWNWS